MQSFHFRHIAAPAPSTAHVVVVRNLKNAQAILNDVKAGGAERFGDTPMTLIDARMIASSTHLLVAVHQALLRNARSFESSEDGRGSTPSSMRTKSIHSEILWNLSTTNNIAETFRIFGLAASTTDLILVHASVAAQDGGPTSDVIVKRVSGICQGDIDERGVDSLDGWKHTGSGAQSNGADWNAITKAYRLNDVRPCIGDEDLSEAELQVVRKERIDAMATSLVSMKFVAS